MKIFIKTCFGKTLTLEVDKHIMISELKLQIKEQTDIAVGQQNIVYLTEVLKDGESLDYYNIKDGYTIYLTILK